MKQKLLCGIYFSLFLLTSYSGNSQDIKFERVLAAPPAASTTPIFEGVFNGSVAFADVNGDTFQDVLITGESSSGPISKLYINDGKDNFTELLNTPFIGVKQGSIAFSDIDNDGDQDVLITGDSSSTNFKRPISNIYTNDGSGGFILATSPSLVGVYRSSIAFSDIDADGDQDVLITGLSSNGLKAILYTNLGGIFTEVTGTSFAGVGDSFIAFADVNGDMDQDVLITGYDKNGDSIAKLYINDGLGDFAEVTTLFLGVERGSVAFADIDGDGDQDVLITGYNWGSRRGSSKLYINGGRGNFTAVNNPFEATEDSSIAFSDVDSDGDQDVLITGYSDSSLKVISKLYSNNGNGIFTEVTGLPFEAVEYSSIAFADIDNDTKPDVLITGSSYLGLISYLYRNLTNTPPTAICQDITVQLSATGTATILAADVDAGSFDTEGPISLSISRDTFSCADIGSAVEVTLTVTDKDGLTDTCMATVTVVDTQKPTVVTQNITVQLDATGNVSIVAVDVNDGSTDVCGIASYAIDIKDFTCANVGDNTVTLTVTDINGNNATQTATVRVEDKTAPVVVTKDITVELDVTGNVSILAADVNNGSTDNCGINLVELDKTSFTCANVGDNTVILTVTDVNGNVATQTATVTVEDKTAPVVVTKDITVELDVTGNVSIVAADVNDGSTDNCGISLVELDKTSFTCANVGDNTVTLKVTDVNGNVASETAIVTVEDKTAPVVVTKNKTIQLNAFGTASIVAADVNNGSTDNCGISLVELDKTSFTCANVGDNTVILTVTDVNGNVATQTATVTVEDKTAPVVVTKDITVELDVTGNVSIVAADVNNGSTDNCGINLLELDKTSFTCANVGDNTVTLKVTDVNGNVASETAIVTVEDKTAPVVVTKNKTIQLNASGTASIVAADVNNGSTDNCGISLVELDKTSFTCANVGDNTVILTVTDVNGNVASQTATVTVEDKTAPVVLIKDITVELDASSNITILASDVNNGSTDNCGISLLELDKATFSCGDVGDNTVRLKVTDNSGNVSTKTAIVTVVNTRPNLIRKHFDDVIFFDNSSKAFKGSGYSWYKNGVLVAGQTAQYFKDSGVLNGTYYAIATKTDGTLVMTCPLTFSASIKQEYLKIAPNPVKSNAVYQLITNVDSARLQNARITVFSTLGVLMNDKIVDSETIAMIAPTTEGIYIVKLTLANGTYFTKNLLVKN